VHGADALTSYLGCLAIRSARERLRKEGVTGGQSGAVVVVQRTSSDLKLHPHLHVLFLDGAYAEGESGVSFTDLRRRGLLAALDGPLFDDQDTTEPDGLAALAASATSGRSPPAGPEWRRRSTPLSPPVAAPLHYDKPLCASLDGFTLHAATRAGAMDSVGREALCKYVLRPPIAQERVTHGPDGLVRITLKKPFADGTVAVDMEVTVPPWVLTLLIPSPAIQYASAPSIARAPSNSIFVDVARVVTAPPAFETFSTATAELSVQYTFASSIATQMGEPPVARVTSAPPATGTLTMRPEPLDGSLPSRGGPRSTRARVAIRPQGSGWHRLAAERPSQPVSPARRPSSRRFARRP